MDYAKIMFKDKPVVDQKAYMLTEIASIYGCARSNVSRVAQEHILSGEWEEVRKRDAKGRLVKAYRPKRK